MPDYVTRLTRACRSKRSALCVGIDPSPELLALLDPEHSGVDSTDVDQSAHAAAAERFGGHIVDAARDRAVAVKFQLAWYEYAGAPGLRALARSVTYARRAGLLVIADGKRGDIARSAAAYARAYLGTSASSGVCADALTVNAAVGADALEVFTDIARERDCCIYALAHTSNPGARQLQGALLADGRREWWHLLCAAIASTGAGAVIGATHERALETARELLPRSPLLVPGIGAQGGAVESLAPLVAEGAPPVLVSVSRGMLPTGPRGLPDFKAHVSTQAVELADATWKVLGGKIAA